MKIFVDIIVLLTIFINIIYIPLDIAFILNDTKNFYIFNLIPTGIFTVEILLNFNTAFYDKGEINYKRKDIIMNYLKQNFTLDILVTLPVFLSNFINFDYLNLILLLRLKRLK